MGEKFQKDEIFVPEMLIAAKTMKRVLKSSNPNLAAARLQNLESASSARCMGTCTTSAKTLWL
ncbi:MAG: B12-binding domain-containing protein [Spirochaetaceae bacterium]|nr:B12-binding domain-containing protein [Spirochaetaceae bacterium]